MILEYNDSKYHFITTLHTNGLSTDFKIYKEDPSMGKDLFIEGRLDWQGCLNFKFPSDQGYLHACDQKDFAKEMDFVMAGIYRLGALLMKDRAIFIPLAPRMDEVQVKGLVEKAYQEFLKTPEKDRKYLIIDTNTTGEKK